MLNFEWPLDWRHAHEVKKMEAVSQGVMELSLLQAILVSVT